MQSDKSHVDKITQKFLAKEPEFLPSNTKDEPWYRIRVKWNKFALIKRKEFTSRSATIFDIKCESFTKSDTNNSYPPKNDLVNKKKKRRFRHRKRFYKKKIVATN